jgi:hypothetical protein
MQLMGVFFSYSSPATRVAQAIAGIGKSRSQDTPFWHIQRLFNRFACGSEEPSD